MLSSIEHGVHPCLDVREVDRVFAGSDVSLLDTFGIMGPRDYWGFKKFRAERCPAPSSPVSADLFLWGQIPDASRCASRIGGVPYMAREDDWPVSEGVPATFWCQLSFADSAGIVGDVPADLLLVFRNPHIPAYAEGAFEFRWVDSDSVSAVWERGDLPGGVSLISELSAARVRDVDYCDNPWDSSAALSVAPAIKIAGIPLFGQPFTGEEPSDRATFIAQIVSLAPRLGVPYPLVGRSSAMSGDDVDDAGYRFFESELRVALFLDSKGDVWPFVTMV